MGVVGCGLMGSGIAEVGAKAGLDVVVFEVDEGAASAGRSRIEDSLDRGVKRGKLTDEERMAALGRIRLCTDYDELADRELVIEAVAENPEVKLGVFKALDAAVSSPDAVLASNTSSIPIMRLAMATSRPEKVLGLHFFNPVPVMRLVELVPSLLTDEVSVELARTAMREQLDKLVVTSKDRSGFIVNSLLIPYQLAAIRMLESGFASAEDIDTGVVEGLAHPMGPLTLADLIGLDTVLAVADSLYEEFREQLYAPPPLLCRMVEAGLLGRKTGRGFFDYSH
jgi:3-hydroxybutyryl-CoA dehydrogenase